jgi:hypothetical protein
MQAVLQCVLVVGGSVALAVVGLELVRRLLPPALQMEDQSIAGHFSAAIDRLYGVLLAFVVILVWNHFEDGKVIVAREANQVGDLSRMAKVFSPSVEQSIRKALINYTAGVIEDEWPAMARHRESTRTWMAMEQLWNTVREVHPSTPQETVAYDRILFRLNELSDSHRLRLLASEDRVPGILWALLILGGGATVASTYFLRLNSHAPQVLLTVLVAGVIGFILFLIISLNSPFAGSIRLPPDALQHELQRIQSAASE